LAIQVEKQLGEPAGVKVGIVLELGFDEHQWPVRRVFRRNQHPVPLKAGLLDLFGAQGVARRRLQTGQLQYQPRPVLK